MNTETKEKPLTLGSVSLSIYSDLISTFSHEILVESLINEQITRLKFGRLIKAETPQPILEQATNNSLNVLANGTSTNSQTPSQNTSRMGTPSTEMMARVEFVNVLGRDVFGNAKIPDSNRFFNCTNCSRKIAGNRFAAHVDRCLGGRQRK